MASLVSSSDGHRGHGLAPHASASLPLPLSCRCREGAPPLTSQWCSFSICLNKLAQPAPLQMFIHRLLELHQPRNHSTRPFFVTIAFVPLSALHDGWLPHHTHTMLRSRPHNGELVDTSISPSPPGFKPSAGPARVGPPLRLICIATPPQPRVQPVLPLRRCCTSRLTAAGLMQSVPAQRATCSAACNANPISIGAVAVVFAAALLTGWIDWRTPTLPPASVGPHVPVMGAASSFERVLARGCVTCPVAPAATSQYASASPAIRRFGHVGDQAPMGFEFTGHWVPLRPASNTPPPGAIRGRQPLRGGCE